MMNKSLLGSPRKGWNSTKVTFGDSTIDGGSPKRVRNIIQYMRTWFIYFILGSWIIFLSIQLW